MTFTSRSFNSMMLLPSRPATYRISTPIAGFISPRVKSSAFTTDTFGVVMSTRWSNRLETAVADEPRLMFIISPMASISISLNILLPIFLPAPSLYFFFRCL